MQKKIIALAVAGLVSGAGFSSVAIAADNVTVYGVVDAFYGSVKATDSDRRSVINSAGLSGSRIGFKGVEDLGNGTSALFVVEYGFSIDDGNRVGGTDSGLAARQKLIGLTGSWGTAVAGYAQTAGYDFACATTPFAGSALDPQKAVGVGTLLSCGNNGRAGNAFAYISPSFGGVTFAYNHSRVTELGAETAATAQTVDVTTGSTAQPIDTTTTTTSTNGVNDVTANLLAVSYGAGPLAINAVYSKVSDSDLVYLPVKSLKELGLRASYNLGVASLFASYQTRDLQDVDNKDKTMTFGAAIPVGAAGTVAVDYARSTLKETVGPDNNKMDSYAVAYLHSLSKRTTAYAGWNHTAEKFDPAKTYKTDVLAVGLRHTF
jgi:general bacterial porin, GBP family